MKRTILISTLANGLTSQPNTIEEKVAVMFGEVNSDLSQCYDILPGMLSSNLVTPLHVTYGANSVKISYSRIQPILRSYKLKFFHLILISAYLFWKSLPDHFRIFSS